MTKQITIPGIIVAVIIMVTLFTLPNGDVTDTKSAIKNAREGYATDTIVNAGSEAIEITGKQAIESACSNGPSQSCSTTVSSINLIAVVFVVLIIVIIVVGIIGFAKWIMNVIESF